jgi:hypothetical protein
MVARLAVFGIFLGGVFFTGPLKANEIQFDSVEQSDDYLTIGSVDVQEVTSPTTQPDNKANIDFSTNPPTGQLPLPTPGQQTGQLPLPNKVLPPSIQLPGVGSQAWNDAIRSITGLDINGWIAIGSAAWKFLESNRPVITNSSGVVKTISILPQAVTSFAAMTDWSFPVVKTYNITYKNLLGMEVVRFTYQISYNYGGKYLGKGHYIADLKMIPKDISALSGYNVSAQFQANEAVNVAGSDDPVVGLSFELQLKVKTILKENDTSQAYFVTGLGALSSL